MTGEDLFLFGSFYALNPGIRPRVKVFLEKAREAEAVVLYDPNFRSTHLEKRSELLDLIVENISYATLVRASDEDLGNIFGVKNADEAWEVVRPHCSFLIYTANARGVFLRTEKLRLDLEVDPVKPVSTIGAGDTFNAGVLYGLYRMGCTRNQIGLLEKSHWEQILRLAIGFSREVCLSYDNYLPRDYAQQIIEKTRLWKKENWADHP
jgi:fructokinase